MLSLNLSQQRLSRHITLDAFLYKKKKDFEVEFLEFFKKKYFIVDLRTKGVFFFK